MLHSDAFSAELEALGLDSSIFGAAGIPAPIFQALVPRAAGIFDERAHTFGTANEPATFTRASTGLYRDSDGILTERASNTIRTEYDASGAFLGYLFEPAETNVLLRSTNFAHGDWTKSSSASVAASAITAPDGSSDAETITDPGGAGSGILNTARLFQIIAIANDSTNWTASIFIAKTSATPAALPIFNLGFLGGTSKNAFTAIDPSDGSTGYPTDTGVIGASAADSVIVEDYGLWWRLSTTYANNSSGNNQGLVRLLPAATTGLTSGFDATLAGSADVWQADLVNAGAESSPIVTTSASVTRAADTLPWAANAGFNASEGFLIGDMRVARRPSLIVAPFSTGVFSVKTTKLSLMRAIQKSGGSSVHRLTMENDGGTDAYVDTGDISSFRFAARWDSNIQAGYDSGSGFSWGAARSKVALNDDGVINVAVEPNGSIWLKNLALFNRGLSAAEIGRIFAL